MQKILIENFGPIEYAEIEITQIVVLIGEQASGKSTISKLIYFFKSIKDDFFSFIYEDRKNIKEYLFNFSDKIRKKFEIFFPFSKNIDSFSVKYYYSDSNSIDVVKEVKKERPSIIYHGFATSENETKLKLIFKNLHPTKISSDIYERNTLEQEKSKAVKHLIEFVENFFQDKATLMYVPAGRNITVTYSGQFKLLFFSELSKQFDKVLENMNNGIYSKSFSADMYLMKKYIEEIEGIKDQFKDTDFNILIKNKKVNFANFDDKLLYYANEIIRKILKGEYSCDSENEKIIYSDNSKDFVYLHNASSGQQEVIRILQDLFIILLEEKNVFRVIEEPEAHLYPVAQKYIIDLIASVVNNTKSHIIITTHSPYILSVFNNLLYSAKILETDKKISKEISEIIPKYSQLNPLIFRAYSLKNITKTYIDDNLPYCQSIFDEKTGMIEQNYLDEVSEELGDDFDLLYNIHKKTINEKG